MIRRAGGRARLVPRSDSHRGESILLGTLAPGNYRLRATEMRLVSTSHAGQAWLSWRLGENYGDPIDVVLHADGSCTPSAVWPDGLAR